MILVAAVSSYFFMKEGFIFSAKDEGGTEPKSTFS